MKRNSSALAEEPVAKKRMVGYDTFLKWRTDLDRDCQTVSWLDCETDTKPKAKAGQKTVTKLKCKVCTKFKAKITTRRNFSNRWIAGAESVRTSNIRDHAHSDQHMHAMLLLKKEHADAKGLGAASYAPIAQLLQGLSVDERAKLSKKFDIAYFAATEKLAFTKYPSICQLEARHGVDIGTSYLNKSAGMTFCHFITESRRQELRTILSSAKFFSILMDGSTDKGNIDDELFLVLYCDTNGSDEKVHTQMSYFTVARPQAVTAEGLFECLQSGLGQLGIEAIDAAAEDCKRLVGIGTDGAAANIASGGLKGLVEKELPWVYWMWCLAHRLELAIKDALKGTSFDFIDEMLLRLYYIYEKSPKKCRELEEIVTELRGCLQFDDAGVRPVRASGSRWVSHKLNAMKRVLSKFGAYTNHLAALSEDGSVKASDRAKLRGFYTRWVDAKYLLGCALFVDLLTPCAIFSKVMQNDDLDVLGALLRTVKEINKLSSKSLEHWSTYTATLKKLTEEDGEMVYQCQTLKKFEQAKRLYQSHHQEYCSSVTGCLKSRLAWSDLQVVRDIIFLLATQGWQKVVDEEEESEPEHDNDKPDPMEAIVRLGERFKHPLEAAGADLDELPKEFREVLIYATQFISLSSMDYQAVWWRLFHAPNASEWSNILILAQLIFSLPVSNGKLERIFSTLKIIKVDKRASLSNSTLDDLLVLNADKIPVQDFNPDPSIDLWWNAKTRRLNQKPRKEYKKRSSQSKEKDNSDGEDTETDTSTVLLNDWDEWMNESEAETM